MYKNIHLKYSIFLLKGSLHIICNYGKSELKIIDVKKRKNTNLYIFVSDESKVDVEHEL